MSGHLFLGGPVHGEWHDLPGIPRLWEFAVCPEMPVVSYTSKDELVLDDPLEITRFGYIPRRLRLGRDFITVYVPAHMSEDLQWEVVKVHALGEVPEG